MLDKVSGFPGVKFTFWVGGSPFFYIIWAPTESKKGRWWKKKDCIFSLLYKKQTDVGHIYIFFVCEVKQTSMMCPLGSSLFLFIKIFQKI